MKNAYSIVTEFEERVAEFAGSKYAVAVDCCTNAIFLSMLYLARKHEEKNPGKLSLLPVITIPARTYISVPFAVQRSKHRIVFENFNWNGEYYLHPYQVIDGAKRFRRGMFTGEWFRCLSFHYKKHVPIGRGGMILTGNLEARDWLRRMRYDGREGIPYDQEKVEFPGYHMTMTPEQAARGLALLDVLPSDNLPDLMEDYPDLRLMPVFQK